jgi:hypothetical protein
VYVYWTKGNQPPEVRDQFASGDFYKVLITGVDLEMAQGVGEDYVRKNGIGALTARKAAWRSRPPTDKQIEAARKWNVGVQPEWSAGEVSDAIGAKAEEGKYNKRDRKPNPRAQFYAQKGSRW